MEPFGQDVQRSIMMSRKREEIIVALSSLSEAYPRALARAVGVDVTRLHEIMHGCPPRYSVDLSPIALGLAEDCPTPHGRAYSITPKGRRKARQLTSRKVREEVARQAKRAWSRGERTLQVYAQARAEKPQPVRAPVAAARVDHTTATVTLHLHNP